MYEKLEDINLENRINQEIKDNRHYQSKNNKDNKNIQNSTDKYGNKDTGKVKKRMTKLNQKK